jgi:hypothetical protein
MKTLIFCPLNPNQPRLWGRTVQSIFRLQWDGPLDWLFVANDNPHDEPYDNVTHNYERARRQALAGGYDALLTVEADMIVPPDALTKLVACESDVAYGLYVWRHGRRKWSAYTAVETRYGKSLSEDSERAKAAWGQIVDVAGVGLGCTLIRRRVLAGLDFHMGDERQVSCDWYFALDCQAEGYTQRAHLGVVCGHQSMKPWPQIVWPSNEGRLYYVESLEPPLEKRLTPGETVSVQVGMGENAIYRQRVGQL